MDRTIYEIEFDPPLVYLRLLNAIYHNNVIVAAEHFTATFTLAEWSQMARATSPPKPSRSTLAGDLANTRYPS